MPRYNGTANLIPVTRRSKEEAKELARRGGVNSGVSRRKSKTMAEIIKKMLDAPLKKGTDLHRQVISQLGNLVGEADDPTVEEACILACVKKGLRGDTKALEFLRDTQGEKPKDVVVTEGEVVPVEIRPLDGGWVEAEQARQAAAAEAIREAAGGVAKAENTPTVAEESDDGAPSATAEEREDAPPSDLPRPPKPMFYAPKR